ncbi:MAG: Flp pilus assembly protein CpaB [Kiritimatiellia bacterium]|nr:Flp pilus assembly protein CpaB [Kiritimatiellia bacterium]
MMGKIKPIILLGVGVVSALMVSIFAYNWLQQESMKAGSRKAEAVKIMPPPAVTNEPKPVASPPVIDKMSLRISPEKRAMAVRVNEVIGVAGFIEPGDHVDALVVTRREEPGNPGVKPVNISKIVLENIPVLAIGKEVESGGRSKEKQQAASVATLEVTPEQGEKLALAVREGEIYLALRNPRSAETLSATKGAVLEHLLWPTNKTVTVEIVAGDKISKVEFRSAAENR